MKSCSILIPSWCGHKATELCIESIIKRTEYKNGYRIIVCDSSPEDSSEREYLRSQSEKGNIRLIVNNSRLRHGDALWKMLVVCNTEIAVILDSDNEILSGDWLNIFTSPIHDPDKDLGVGFLIKGGNRPNNDFFFAPVFHPSHLILNMRLYRQIMRPDDWLCSKIPVSDFKYKEQLGAMSVTEAAEWFEYERTLDRPRIEYDSGGLFTERLIYDNSNGLRMYSKPIEFFTKKIKHYGGMSAYHTRLYQPHMQKKYELLLERLKAIREES